MSDTFETFLRVLNEAYEADPAAMHALVRNHVACNKALAAHPTIQVGLNYSVKDTEYSVGMLGVINGLCEAATGKRVAVIFSGHDGSGTIMGFTEYHEYNSEEIA